MEPRRLSLGTYLNQLAEGMAIDGIDRDPCSPAATDGWQPLIFDFASAEAFKTTLRAGDTKVCRQAEKALTALDRIKACAGSR